MGPSQERIDRVIREAEGYLELGLPEQAVGSLRRRSSLVKESGRASYLFGESLRELECYSEAVEPLEQAALFLPSDMHVHLALAWCYKRTRRLSSAIDALERALRCDPLEAILHYNLACYWSLSHDHHRALRALGRALDLDGNYLDMVPYESDFDTIRDDHEFQMLTSVIV